jgi:small subunit ribosomal protein S8
MDKIANMLSGIKNAGKARKETVVAPFSKLKLEIAKSLVAAGYLKAVKEITIGNHPGLELVLMYNKDGEHRIGDVKRVSKSSKRVYKGVKDIKPVKFGQGTVFLSTPKGILTGKEARKEMVGGEALFEIW